MKAMILAAGRGERMRPLTDKCPKPLLKVKGKALIEYHIESLIKAGVKDIVINHAWLGQKIVETLGDGKRWGINIQYSHENQALETAGGIIKALPLLAGSENDEFIVVNGDIYTDYDFTRISAKALDKPVQAHLVMVENPKHHPKGDFSINQKGFLLQDDSNEKFTFSGIAKYHIDFFTTLADLYQQKPEPLAPLLIKAIKHLKVTGEVFRGYWSDVGTIERLQETNQFVLSGLSSEKAPN
ncbi:MAG: nucleotidyltransferase family protein [Gammaproteobacteria bacterium]|nr:nucleotidyltransferase family protein [Gammaproteobacteria bacterium]